jgi:WhiB family redox-sensing transcriptional regulator
MPVGAASDHAAWLLPAGARTEWLTLARVLADHGPPPCEEGDPEAWWPHKGDPAQSARGGCEVCPARVECLAYAVAAGEREGLWGGLLPEERRAVRLDDVA